MATRRAVAVLKIKNPEDYKSVVSRATAVVDSMTENVSIYTLPDPPLATITAQIAVVQGYAVKVTEGDHTKLTLRNEASVTLYAILQEELIYVNKIGNHDRGILEQSGFEVSDEPNPRPIPAQVIIKKIEEGLEDNTAKIYISALDQDRLTFIVQMTSTPAVEESWKQVLVKSSSRDLIVTNLVHGQEVWFRVNATNATGTSMWSPVVNYIPQH